MMHVDKCFVITVVCRVCNVKIIIIINNQIYVPAVCVSTIIDVGEIPIISIINAMSDLVISTVNMDDMNVAI